MKKTVQKTLTTLALIVAMMTAGAAVVQAQTVNMNSYITLTVEDGEEIGLDFKAASNGTPVRIVSGSNTQDITVGTSWYDGNTPSNFTVTSDGTTMKVYGDITGFDCNGNGANVTSLDVSNNTALTLLYCYNNSLTSLDVSNNTALTKLSCFGNQLTSLNVSGCTALTELYCYGNQLTSLDVSNNTALTLLYCYNNSLTSLDVSNNTALTLLSCFENNMDACALDNLFHSLPQRQTSDDAKVYIKNGSSTNPGAGGCRTPIAKDKNWKVMDFNGAPSNSTEINNSNFTCVPNMSRYITLTVQSGETIKLDLMAASDGTPVRIVSGSNTQDITVGTSWTGFQNYTSDGTTMKVYGDVTRFDCRDNGVTSLDVSSNTALINLYCSRNQLTSLDVSNNTALTLLSCLDNQLTSLDVSGCTALTYLYCSNNNFSTAALDAIYCALPDRNGKGEGKIQPVFNASSTNHATVLKTTKGNATAKNWNVQYYADNTDIPATTGNYTCATSVRDVPALEAVRLYPNPVENVLRIEAEDEVRSIHIYNVYGAEVASAVATSEISLAHLPAGVYAVQVNTDKGIATQRVVKR